MSFLSSISMTIWFTIMMDMINHKIKDVELTNFQTTEHAFRLWGNVAGGVVAIIAVGSLKIEIAIWMQCIANALFAFIDWKAYTGLKV
jgi:predicted permease